MSSMQDAAAWMGIALQAKRDKQLTGSERELLGFNAEQAQIAREFNANEALLNRQFQSSEAEIARQWQEDMYNQYQSPEAMIRQYKAAGLNPALMYGSAAGGSIPTASSPSGSSASGSAAAGSMPARATNIMDSFLKLAQLDASISNINADTQSKLASTESTLIANDYSRSSNPLNLQVLQNDLSLASKQLRDYDDKHLLNTLSARLSSAQTDKIFAEIDKTLVDTATARLEQQNIKATKDKIIAEVYNLQVQRSLMELQKISETKRHKSMDTEQLVREFDYKWQQDFGSKPNAGLAPAALGMLGRGAQHIESLARSFDKWVSSWFD